MRTSHSRNIDVSRAKRGGTPSRTAAARPAQRAQNMYTASAAELRGCPAPIRPFQGGRKGRRPILPPLQERRVLMARPVPRHAGRKAVPIGARRLPSAVRMAVLMRLPVHRLRTAAHCRKAHSSALMHKRARQQALRAESARKKLLPSKFWQSF